MVIIMVIKIKFHDYNQRAIHNYFKIFGEVDRRVGVMFGSDTFYSSEHKAIYVYNLLDNEIITASHTLAGPGYLVGQAPLPSLKKTKKYNSRLVIEKLTIVYLLTKLLFIKKL